MASSGLKRALLVICFTSIGYATDAFTANPYRKSNSLNSLKSNVKQPYQMTQWRMVDDDSSSSATEEVTKTESGRQVSFDANSGRLTFENEEECVPDDEYCAVDKKTGKLIRLTIEEKERIFLDALQSYYINGRQILSDSEFDLLKEDLSWNGSNMINMNRKEAQYLNAMQAYTKGDPVMSDEEYNALKQELREDGSKFAVSKEPKCYIDTGICTVTFSVDEFRTNLLYLPAGLVTSLVWIGLGYEIVSIFGKINPLLLAVLGSPLYFTASKYLTEKFIFPNQKIAYGPCPSCETENRVYFGDILGVEGYKDVAQVKCSDKKCKTTFRVQRESMRASTLPM